MLLDTTHLHTNEEEKAILMPNVMHQDDKFSS